MVSASENPTQALSKTIGKYCKAYQIRDLSTFEQWPQVIDILKHQSSERPPQFIPETVVYLQENYVVTVSIFKERDIIFDQVTPEWQTFCRDVLGFQVPKF
ncbi:MAG: hypothetical protein F6K30_11595 [Cyanothece sp. SIO2G6]|nr:hypothetical protein [Cyanothece sp. SIO2G6]